ncbi:MAG: alpha/beta hydrolase [Bacilli bacterium]|nr:alpha/beta hydrolase [Bacilli bacterium]
MKKKTKRNLIITFSTIGGVLVILTSTFFIYTGIYYHADKEKIETYLKTKDVTTSEVANGVIKIKGIEEKAGLIFYPGGKVEYLAYEPICAALAHQGVTSYLVHMPFNLAIFGVNKADGIKAYSPEITRWFMAGHSLGGAMGSGYIASHPTEYEGLILLGAYPYKDLSKTDINLLLMFGSNDLVMNKDKFNSSMPYWPKKTEQYVIEGGVHSYFGMYGNQEGDGISNITVEEQTEIAASKIIEYYNI